MLTMAEADDIDNFKAAFKLYKRRDRPLDLSDVVDVSDSSCQLCSQNVSVVKPAVTNLPSVHGLLPAADWKIFSFSAHYGFYMIRNPFLPGYQRYWVHRCLADLHLLPNVTNLRVHPDINPHTIWSDFSQRSIKEEGLSSTSALRKLRWTTIGYHYDWDTKEYREDHHTPFPTDIGVLAQYIAATLGFQQFQAEAGIINYYHLDSTLGGHTDHSELDHDAPLLSISFGQDAIFLLGGPTKATKPTAIMLHSGDICVMSGPSRLAYHAVPRILATQSTGAPSCFTLPSNDESGDASSDSLESASRGERVKIPDSEGDVKENHSLSCAGDSSKETSSGSFSCSGEQETASQASSEQLYLKKCEGKAHPDLENQQGQGRGECQSCEQSSVKDASTVSGQTERQSAQGEETAGKISFYSSDSSVHHHSPTHDISTVDEVSVWNYAAQVMTVNEKISHTMKTLDWEPLSVYLRTSRINVNIRQVLKPGQTFSSKSSCDTDASQSKRLRTDGN